MQQPCEAGEGAGQAAEAAAAAHERAAADAKVAAAQAALGPPWRVAPADAAKVAERQQRYQKRVEELNARGQVLTRQLSEFQTWLL